MKSLKLLLFLFFSPLLSQSQVLSGIWTGGLSNDSLTIRKDQTFEIALSESAGKVYGYVYSTFIVNDTLYYIIKKVKGVIKGMVCEVKDDEVVTHNFQRPPDKGINVVYTFRHDQRENGWTIDGNWKTNATKKYYSISGEVNATVEKDISKSRLYEHLGDLNLQNTLVFENSKNIKPDNAGSKEKTIKKDVVKTNEKLTEESSQRDAAIHQTKTSGGPDVKKQTSSTPKENIARTEKKLPKEKEIKEDVVKSQLNNAEEKIADAGNVQKPIENRTEIETKIAITKQEDTKKGKPGAEINKPETKNSSSTSVQKPKENKNEAINEIVSAKSEDLKTEKINSETKNPEAKNNNVTAIQKPKEIKKDTINEIVSAKPEEVKTEKVNSETKNPEAKNNTTATAQKPNEIKKDAINEVVSAKPVEAKTEKSNSETKNPEAKNNNVTAVQKPIDKKEIPGNTIAVKEQPGNNTVSDIAKTKEINQDEKNTDPDYVFAELKRKERKLNLASTMIESRASVPTETIYFKSDSLVLALYDNGEIDGDTVSVLLNGDLIIEKQGLKSAAFKKTIYLAPDDTDSLLLVLYAENLGLYPPNTGLLIVKDGDESYYVRFNADYSKNAAILLRRKLK